MISLISYFRQGEYVLGVLALLSRAFVVLICCPVHEMAHAYAAYKLGDNTAKYKGRLTINPMAHLSLVGSLMIFFVGFGYAKPVPVNPNNFKNPKKGMALTSVAGPLSNLIMAGISICFTYVFWIIEAKAGSTTFLDYCAIFFQFSASVNIMLAVFNILPIPPLDGSKVLSSIFPDRVYFKYMQYEQYAMIALLLVMMSGILDTPISWLSSVLTKILCIIPNLIYNLIV